MPMSAHNPLPRTLLHNKAERIAREVGFALGREIYRGAYYTPDRVRNIIFEGTLRGEPALLKLYDDPRITYEPRDQIAFNRINTSTMLVAPKVYRYKILSPHKGWLIMEKLPEKGRFFSQPVANKKEFAALYLEYRTHFPLKPTRPLTLAERLPADEFHHYRIHRWFELAHAQESARRKAMLDPNAFLPRYAQALKCIRQEFKTRKMVWCHGHFKPHELYKIHNQNLYYLTDFAHTHLYPEGYEFGFIIWADWFMSADWRLPYGKWKKGVDEWMRVLRPVADTLGIKKYGRLIAASLLERILGTILADITASEKPRKEQEKRVTLLYRLLNDILNIERKW
ncbi:MAG: hypothetical protein WC659_01425 [Patescibacteria group bacterium]